jgi:cytochrome b6-f complex iron-sulfur subunit
VNISTSDHSSPDSCQTCNFSRREFLQLLAAGAGVAIIGGCGSGGESTSATELGTSYRPIPAEQSGNEYKVAGAGSLKSGQAFAFVLPDQSQGIVFRTKDNELRALSAKCTHAGCIVEWRNSALFCPCHGSKFDTSGKVLSGPATEPLPQMKVRQAEGDAFITPQG